MLYSNLGQRGQTGDVGTFAGGPNMPLTMMKGPRSKRQLLVYYAITATEILNKTRGDIGANIW